MGTHPVSTVHAGTYPKEGWVNGDQSGSLVVLDPEGKFIPAFPIKKTDVSVQVSGPLDRAQVIQ